MTPAIVALTHSVQASVPVSKKWIGSRLARCDRRMLLQAFLSLQIEGKLDPSATLGPVRAGDSGPKNREQ